MSNKDIIMDHLYSNYLNSLTLVAYLNYETLVIISLIVIAGVIYLYVTFSFFLNRSIYYL